MWSHANASSVDATPMKKVIIFINRAFEFSGIVLYLCFRKSSQITAVIELEPEEVVERVELKRDERKSPGRPGIIAETIVEMRIWLAPAPKLTKNSSRH